MKCREIELYTIKNEEYKAFKKIAALEEENFVLKEKLEETIRADEKEITALKDELRILHERLKVKAKVVSRLISMFRERIIGLRELKKAREGFHQGEYRVGSRILTQTQWYIHKSAREYFILNI